MFHTVTHHAVLAALAVVVGVLALVTLYFFALMISA